MTESEADRIIRHLVLRPHPEGGWFRETFRDSGSEGARAHSTAIYFLLREGEASHWHRVDAVETWHFYRGAPLRLSLAGGEGAPVHHVLGHAVEEDQQPQLVVPKGVWQAARSLGAYTLVGCTVAPGFEFAGFELAPPGWAPVGG
ncbi:MAG: cupin domain-containing protein [Alphaproteobacteria bacterium]|nr:cupin domain-containing protein [Alphaproteobacteria bacterium]MBU6472005.1 cupin domain-containing protein [Alphaproteobacteria bacterium]MDE2012177.1 cupin domain-containing protein [Alphaproteobacteria bacterium]MDE2072190.1 cupin domain-containing protein [Alphaproteobacteria bacterium]